MMVSLNKRNKVSQSPLIQFLILEFICIVLMAADHHSAILRPVRMAISTLAIPIIKVVEWPQSVWSSGRQTLARQTELLNENTELKKQLLDATLKSQQNAVLLEENRRLRNMLKASELLPLKTSVAFVSNIHIDDQRHQIVINQGSLDTVYVGQAVLGLNGVVGQVNSVGLKNAHVILITDPTQAVPVESLRTGMRTLAYGHDQNRRIILPEIASSADVQIGDIFVTSGFGGLYPKGLKFATIESLGDSENQAFKLALAKPFAELSQLTEVFLVWPEEEAAP
ncbi:rod shape-determining protein MreC [Marinicella sp. W31]|uniref:rod shape-determining protein MreC n=1 Tax=Marinicella sp. W31 TaxID=3023713 RepID=UPI0037572786